MRRLLVLALLASLATPAFAKKAPWAEIDGTFAVPTDPDQADVQVAGVDGQRFVPVRAKQKVTPGPHFVYLVSERAAGLGLRNAKPWVMKAEPCTRYLLAARHENLSAERYEIVVVGTERIGECRMPEGATPAPAPATAPTASPSPAAAPETTPSPVAPADETGATQY